MTHDATVRGLASSETVEGGSVPVVLLDAGGTVVPIFVSPDQARSMQHALEDEPFERPLTHDLLLEVAREFGGAIDRVRIDDLADGTFYAKLDAEEYRDGDRRQVTFDARPSDAIALALRLDCPITVSEHVVERAGRPPGEFESL